ncbi:ComEC/Rec2 family competence protein [Enterococcus saccharolyticus]|uniref:Metallo-beta-lactamase domain-containing protein n=1 Tax=Enterococcus saccharolyticus subsp. saccharolyticus ATCC 43076 TaxID=1139996 RepID=S0JCF2_9ENTE|nr:MBL fold metallo-hydrolase [Enterococcus saccharolyticus]EOT30007.1 hypothetical protein OMQ_00699 [Enterococcus saccharolyticus subsp. saccharolyticus ATCC 43076]EOT80553.1 hypothetical protein I572_01080 [Enterococcus saccharolyticus subsp. saccharolyticus ATCC 43076]OJG90092.1 hypothetical protein RV16_GL001902 [Enterococcus saccharolyticus]
MRKIRIKVLKQSWFIFRFILFIGVLTGAFFLIRYHNTEKDNTKSVDVFFLSTANDANATLIKQGGNTVLIDTGEEEDHKALLNLLQENGVTKIDYLILTHPDKDHIGGVSTIVDNFEVSHVIMPYYGKDHAKLAKITQELIATDSSITYPSRPRNFSLGALKLTIYPPLERHYKKDNNYSLATLITHQQINMLFVGDSESKRLQELMQVNWPTIDLYLVAHHGRANLSSKSFIEQIKPHITITTAKKNDSEVQEALENVSSISYFTNKQTLHFESDGKEIKRR